MKQHKLGNRQVSAIGVGCMNVSWIWSNGAALDPVRRQESAIPAIHAALDAGVTFLDTADIYAPTWDEFGHNEVFVAEALRTWSGTKEQKNKVVVATKAGISRQPGERWGRNGSLDYLLRAAEASAGRLGVEKIDLWQHHRLDPEIVFETQVANVLALKERGIVSIQNEFSPRYRYDLDVLAVCEKYGVAYLPWSPLGGMNNKKAITDSDAFEEIANKHNVSKYAIALAWEIKTSPSVIPIPGATRTESILDCITALDVTLSDDDFEYLNANLPEQAEYSGELVPKPAHR